MGGYLFARAFVVLSSALIVAACGSSGTNGSSVNPIPARDGGSLPIRDATAPGFVVGDGSTGNHVPDAGQVDLDGQAFAIMPNALRTITVIVGQNTPSVLFTATLGGVPVSAGWSIDRGDRATIPAGPS
ncbi:MAG: hypothetical protein ACREJ3_10825, partial [Polyangiaceae bacterium]